MGSVTNALDFWIFHHRKALVVLLFVPVVAVFAVEDHSWIEQWVFHEEVHILGIGFVFIGTTVRLWATLHIGGNKSQNLVTTGPYALTRNPLYLGSFLSLIGILVLTESVVASLLTLSCLVFIYSRTIRHEEQKLTKLFNEAYGEYIQKVPRFFPKIRALPRLVTKEVYSISYRDIGREVGTALGLLGAAFTIHALEESLEYLRQLGHVPTLISF